MFTCGLKSRLMYLSCKIVTSKENRPPSVDNFFGEIKTYLGQKRKEQSTSIGDRTTENNDDITITTTDIVDFGIGNDWFHGE